MAYSLPSTATASVEAELTSAAASVQILRMDLPVTISSEIGDQASFRFDLSLTPRLRSGLCYTDHWPVERFETPGKLFVLPPAERVFIRSGIGVQKAIVCHLDRDAARHYLETDLEWTDERLVASVDVVDRAIASLLLHLGEEARSPGLASSVLCEAIAAQLTVALYRHFHALSDQPSHGGLSPRRLAMIEERLRSDPAPPTLGDLAELCGISVRQLARGFRESRGVSLGAYIAGSRIERAKDLLADGKNLKSVAHQMGFSSPSSFSHAFRKSTGWTPRAFQRDVAGRTSH